MTKTTQMSDKKLIINQWRIDIETGEFVGSIIQPTRTGRLEPKGAALLEVLAGRPGQLITKDELAVSLWPGQVVTDDALTRVVSRLRKALQDDPRQPAIIETLPKRGYRLIASKVEWETEPKTHAGSTAQKQPVVPSSVVPRRKHWGLIIAALIVVPVVVVMVVSNADNQRSLPQSDADKVLSQADDYYLQMRRLDNEMAIELYQQAAALRPESGAGQAGLANALVQQVIRWPNAADEPAVEVQNLHHAIQQGRTQTAAAKKKLARALGLAERAVKVSPNDPRTHKALGFVYSAQQRYDEAFASYQQAVALDSNAWQALINMGEVLEIQGYNEEALGYYKRAFDAMGRVYDSESAQIQPWYADLAALIAERHSALGHRQDAESWYRHVLKLAPFNANATQGLAQILRQQGEQQAADRLCQHYLERIGKNVCQADEGGVTNDKNG